MKVFITESVLRERLAVRFAFEVQFLEEAQAGIVSGVDLNDEVGTVELVFDVLHHQLDCLAGYALTAESGLCDHH